MKKLFFVTLLLSVSAFAANLPKGYFNWAGTSHYATGTGYYCYLNQHHPEYRSLNSSERMLMFTDRFEGRCEDGVSYNYRNQSYWIDRVSGLYCKYHNFYVELPEMTRRDAQTFFNGPYYGFCNYY